MANNEVHEPVTPLHTLYIKHLLGGLLFKMCKTAVIFFTLYLLNNSVLRI